MDGRERGGEGMAVFHGRENLEARHNLVFKILHGHGGDVSQLLEDLKCPRRILILADCSQHGEYLVQDLARDEAAHANVDVLEEGHAQKGYSCLNRSQDVTVTRELVVPSLGFPPGQFGLHFLQTFPMKLFCVSKSLI